MPCHGSAPRGRTAGSGLLSAGRRAPGRSSGSRPPLPRCTPRNWGRTSRTSPSPRFHSDCGERGGEASYDRLDSIRRDEIRVLFVLGGNSPLQPLSHIQAVSSRDQTDAAP